jgi:hypothetical protein
MYDELMTRLRRRCFVLGLFVLITASPLIAETPAAPDALAIQGEYAGKRIGIQVIALGQSRFEAYLLKGGLPGDGWNRRTRVRYLGETADGATRLVDFDGNVAEITDGSQTQLRKADGKAWMTLNKVHRESPTLGAKPPDDAIVLFDGSNLDAWRDGAAMTDDGLLKAGATTRQAFGDCTLHVEFLMSFEPAKRDMSRGNSGVILNGRYEVQIVDSFGLWPNRIYNAAIFELRDPDHDVTYPPGGWQTYDIDFTATRIDANGNKTADARITVRHNGKLVHDDFAIPRMTNAAFRELRKKPEGDAQPLLLQDHGSPVRFRNVWIIDRTSTDKDSK